MKLNILRGLIVAGVSFLFLIRTAHPAQAASIDVPCDDGDGTAEAALIAAITSANNTPAETDTINLTAGCTYSFSVGDATNNDSALPQITTEIIINGNGATLERNSGAATDFRLLLVTNTGTLTMSDSTIAGNSATIGGGIYNDGTLTVSGSTFIGNSATTGGGIYNAGTLTVSGSTFIGNSATAGGGILNDGSTLTVTNSTFTDNSATAGGGIYNGGAMSVADSTLSGNSATTGGGIYIAYSDNATVTSSILSANSASADGGGIYNHLGWLVVTNSTFTGNTASGNGGGGINNRGTLTVSNSIITGNTTNISGGGLHNSSTGTVTLINSTLADNSADDTGGGIYNEGDEITIINSTLAGNSANYGGGIFQISPDTLTITNSVLTGNSAGSDGGGLYNNGGTVPMTGSTVSGNKALLGGGILNQVGGTLAVTNSIVWGNTSQIANNGTVTVNFSVVQDGFAGTANQSADPRFVSPVSHTLAPTSGGDYRLRPNSPGINAGSNEAVPPGVTTDRDGNPRVVNLTVDFGAYEHSGQLLANGDFEIDLDGDKIPDFWKIKHSTSDKMKCDPQKVNTGLCALKLKGGLDEKAKVIQTIEMSGGPLAAGDTLTLGAYFRRNSVLIKAKFVLKVVYPDSAEKSKSNITVGPSGAYLPVVLPDLTVSTETVERIKVVLKHRSTYSKLFVDTATLTLTAGGSRSRSDVLPPPPVPDGFRGGN